MVRKTALAFGLALAGIASNASADDDRFWFSSETTGSKLMEICGSNWEFGRYDPCGAYLVGIIDGIGTSGELCPPNTESISRQLSVIAYQAVRDEPKRWHYPANFLIQEALVKAFPCK